MPVDPELLSSTRALADAACVRAAEIVAHAERARDDAREARAHSTALRLVCRRVRRGDPAERLLGEGD